MVSNILALCAFDRSYTPLRVRIKLDLHILVWWAHKLDAYIYSPDIYQQHATGGSWPEKYVERGFVA